MSGSDLRYTRVAVALHWIIALLVIVQFAWGWWMQEIPKQPVGPRVDAFNAHKSMGMVILALMLARLGWRLAHKPPPLPPMPGWQAALAHATHSVLYAALIVQPLVGFLGSVFSGFPIKLFGITLAGVSYKHVPLKDLMSTLHLVVSWIIAGAVTLHVAGALKHALVDRDDLWRRMWFGRAVGQ